MPGEEVMGRKSKLTPEVQERLVKAIRAGAYRKIAASLGGICESTLYAWLKDAEEAKSGAKKEFLEAIKRAEAEWEQEQAEAIRETAKGGQLLSRTTTERKDGSTVLTETYTRPEWTARAWLLERKAYERWGKRERHELTGADGGHLTFTLKLGELNDDSN